MRFSPDGISVDGFSMNGFSFGFPVESEIEGFRGFDLIWATENMIDGVWLHVFAIHGVIVLLNLYFG